LDALLRDVIGEWDDADVFSGFFKFPKNLELLLSMVVCPLYVGGRSSDAARLLSLRPIEYRDLYGDELNDDIEEPYKLKLFGQTSRHITDEFMLCELTLL
jgi:hypothetical protein